MASNRSIDQQLTAASRSSSSTNSGTIVSMPIQSIVASIPDAAIVSDAYIKTLLNKIDNNFPKKDTIFTWRDAEYPEDALNDPYIYNGHKTAISLRYNPFGLRLVYELQGATRLYQHTQISDNKFTTNIYKTTAFTDYFSFIKVYNLAYISILKALNGSTEAIEHVKKLFSEQTKLFSDANIKMNFLNDQIKREQNKFVLALLACLILDIVSSKDENISTDARIAALIFLKANFSVRDVATAFIRFKLGYELDSNKEPVFDLIPPKFISSRDERVGNVAHNKIFLQNAALNTIFPKIPSGFGYAFKFDNETFSDLFSHYPEESAQVLFSLLKIDGHALDKTYVFMAIMDIADFPWKKQEKILGIRASYRNRDAQRGLQIQLNSDEDRKLALERRINSAIDDIKLHSPASDRKDYGNDPAPSTPKARAKTNAKEKALTPELAIFIRAREKVIESKNNANLSKIYKLDADHLNLMCCISFDFPVIPVYLKGRLYDYRSLETYINDGFVRDIDRVQHPLDHLQAGFDAQRQMDALFAHQEKITKAQAEAKITDKSLSALELLSIWQEYLVTLKEESSHDANQTFNKCIIAASDQIRYAFLLEFVSNETRDVAFKQFLICKYGKDLYLKYSEAPADIPTNTVRLT
jgi:hypothetical protein